ncbi:clavaminate synthase-like protein At3g21360 [Selaginella moellendorffii]|uniref:clavaminate synthase-like protein At3g21360 n=1 Tax=Selaginella moellendorffii TaxID=88036 RepID=UPI000D1C53DC|nr:clavaminate synthase-like protein At3g21360 [Selaginella moellendorffii]|eukprot:XP_024532138.1 clavaminate synthase-like protein At3g21360 [Selaginella moellendorffii]
MSSFSQLSFSFQKKLDDGSPFPLVLAPAHESSKDAGALARALLIEEQRSQLEEWLIQSGAVLLRGFEVWTAQELDSIIDALGWEEYNYMELGGLANRKRVHGKVLTANDLPLDWYVGYHNEAAYLKKPPSKIAFFAAKPPEPGTRGATPIVPGHVVYKRVLERNHLAEQLLNKGRVVTYSYLNNRAWRMHFSAQDKQTAETNAMKQNMTLTWLPKGEAILESQPLQPLFKKDSAGRMAIFTSIGTFLEFNKMQKKDFPKSTIKFEDGTLLQDETAEELVEIMLEEEVVFSWEKGDVLLVDNSAVLHSRQKCTSKEREILVSLAA